MEIKRYLRHFILFGNVFAILRHRTALKLLKLSFDKVIAESVDITDKNFEDADQLIVYGRIPSKAQKRTLALLENSYDEAGLTAKKGRRVGRRLMLGWHIESKTGKIRERKILSAFLKFISAYLTILVFIFLSKLGLDLVQFDTSIFVKILFFSTCVIILGMPLILFLYISFAPYVAYQETSRLINSHSNRT